jgi:hypothetical protein
MNSEEFIRSQIRKILLQEKVRSVGVGRGGWKGRIKEAGALAKDDPGKLMSNLKIDSVKQKNIAEVKILEEILKKAAAGTPEMSSIFTLPRNQPAAKDKDGNEVESVVLNVSTITPRDAQKYIEHTIVGATNAFKIKWEKEVEITKSGKNIVVFLK